MNKTLRPNVDLSVLFSLPYSFIGSMNALR